MSSYICFHLKRKGVEKKDFFLSYCRPNKIYRCFKDCGIPFYCNDPEPFAEITEKMLNDINIEVKNAIRFGASEKRLEMYRKVYAKYSSPQKIKLKIERKELYQKVVDSYRKKNYQECEEAINLSYQNFYTSLNEGVAERDIQSAMKRIEYFRAFVEKLRKEVK